MKDKKNIWGLLGVADEAKDKAKKLARKANKNMGKWVEDLILSHEEDMDSSEPKEIFAGAVGSSLLHYKPKEFQNNNHSSSNMRDIIEEATMANIDVKLDDITKQLASIALQIYDLKINDKFEKKSFWSRFS